MSDQYAKPSNRYTVQPIAGGYVVLAPDGVRASEPVMFSTQAMLLRDKIQREADQRAKRGPRPCMCCETLFTSDGIHNRMCDQCRKSGKVAMVDYGSKGSKIMPRKGGN
jgi:hypothetical protein